MAKAAFGLPGSTQANCFRFAPCMLVPVLVQYPGPHFASSKMADGLLGKLTFSCFYLALASEFSLEMWSLRMHNDVELVIETLRTRDFYHEERGRRKIEV